MKAVTAALPTGEGWVYEPKWDGMRAIVEVTDGRTQIFTSNGRDATLAFPEVSALGPALAPLDVVLDGELVALDARGHPSFERLQHRMHVTTATDAARRATEVPVALILFDLLQLGETWTTGLAWHERRSLLESVTGSVELPPGVSVTPVFSDGAALLNSAGAQNLEGVIAKRTGSHYAEGRRSRDWVKVKVWHRQEFVVGGWAEGQGERAGQLGALLVGYYRGDGEPRLTYAGRVGTGFDAATLWDLRRRLTDLATTECPFDPPPPRDSRRLVHWVRPALVAEVSFAHWTDDGYLRHPAYLGLRIDVEPSAVVREPVTKRRRPPPNLPREALES
jgi:bifunctional non-homologous end joining protein LigD